MLNIGMVAAITTSEARGTPAIPFDVTITPASSCHWVTRSTSTAR
jgi:hypothetical protein